MLNQFVFQRGKCLRHIPFPLVLPLHIVPQERGIKYQFTIHIAFYQSDDLLPEYNCHTVLAPSPDVVFCIFYAIHAGHAGVACYTNVPANLEDVLGILLPHKAKCESFRGYYGFFKLIICKNIKNHMRYLFEVLARKNSMAFFPFSQV